MQLFTCGHFLSNYDQCNKRHSRVVFLTNWTSPKAPLPMTFTFSKSSAFIRKAFSSSAGRSSVKIKHNTIFSKNYCCPLKLRTFWYLTIYSCLGTVLTSVQEIFHIFMPSDRWEWTVSHKSLDTVLQCKKTHVKAFTALLTVWRLIFR